MKYQKILIFNELMAADIEIFLTFQSLIAVDFTYLNSQKYLWINFKLWTKYSVSFKSLDENLHIKIKYQKS